MKNLISMILSGCLFFGGGCLDNALNPGAEKDTKNTPPVIETTPIETATTGNLYMYDVNAYDPEGEDVIYSFINSLVIPSGMNIVPDTGLIYWTPNATHTGNIYEIVVGVSDGVHTTKQIFNVAVN